MNVKEILENLFSNKGIYQNINPKTKSGNIDMSNSVFAQKVKVDQYCLNIPGNKLTNMLLKGNNISIEDYNYKMGLGDSFIGVERPFPVTMMASRDELVDKLILNLKNINWIHIYGEIWSGKTHLLYLLSEKVFDYKWLSLDGLYDDNIIFHLKSSMQYVTNKFASNTQEILDNYVCSMSPKSVLFIDGIQTKHINSNEFLALLGALYRACINKDIKLITSGYSDFNNEMYNYISKGDFYSESIPGLSVEDIEELLDKYGAPKDKRFKQISKVLAVYSGVTPGLVVEAIKDTKYTDWEIDEKFWEKIFSSDIGSLEEILEELLVSKLSEEERILLFRISYVGHDFPENILSELAKIKPAINDFMKIKLQLYSRWIQRDNSLTKANKLYTSIAKKNLSADEKTKIDEIIVDYFNNLKSINQIDFINLTAHLINLGKFDDVGILYAQMLASMIEKKISTEQIPISEFWYELPLPSNMSTEVKILVRMQQVRYSAFFNKDTSLPLLDLVEIVNKTHTGGEYVLMLIVMSNTDNKVVSICIDTALKNNLWGECRKKLMNMLEGSVCWKYKNMDIFDLSILIYALSISSLGEMQVFSQHLIQCDPNEICRIVENNNNLLLSVAERVREDTNDYDIYDNILTNILEWAKANSLEVVATELIIAKMRLYSENLNDYDATLELYKSTLKVIKSNSSRHFIIDAMAKINVDNKNICNDKALITSAYESMGKSSRDQICDIYTCLNYMEYISEKNKKLEASERMLNIGRDLKNSKVELSIYYRVIGEYYINAYLCGELKLNFKGFYDYILDLLSSNFDLKKNLIVYITHMIGYIVPDVVSNSPPQKLEGGYIYTPPYRKMLMNINKSELVANLYSEIKESQSLLLISELAFYYQEKEIANTIVINLVSEGKLITDIASCIFYLSSFLSHILIKNCFFEQYFDLVTKFIEQNGTNQKVILRFISFIALYVIHDSNEKEMAFVDDKLIDLLCNYGCDEYTKKYFKEFGRILQTFKNEEGEYEILLWCGSRLEGTDKSNICGVINILMLATTKKERNQDLVLAVNSFLKELSLDDDVFVRNVVNEFN